MNATHARHAAATLLCASMLAITGCQSNTAADTDLSARAVAGFDDTRNVSRAGDVTFAGQPSEQTLERYAAEGGTMVIDLRTHEGSDTASFDERTRVEGLGMDYVHIPVSPSTFSTTDVKLFIQAVRDAPGPIMLHCGSANRAGGMWAAYLALEKGVPTDEAIAAGKAAGMSSDSVEQAARRVIEQGGG